MLKAIVIDDEPIALEVIKGLTEKVTFVELEGYFTNSLEGLRFLQTNNLIFSFYKFLASQAFSQNFLPPCLFSLSMIFPCYVSTKSIIYFTSNVAFTLVMLVVRGSDSGLAPR